MIKRSRQKSKYIENEKRWESDCNNNSVNPTRESSIASAVESKVNYEDPDSKEWKGATFISRTFTCSKLAIEAGVSQ